MASINRRAFNLCVAEQKAMGMPAAEASAHCKGMAKTGHMLGQPKPKPKKVNKDK